MCSLGDWMLLTGPIGTHCSRQGEECQVLMGKQLKPTSPASSKASGNYLWRMLLFLLEDPWTKRFPASKKK